MTQTDTNQYTALKAKTTLNVDETAVVVAYDAAVVAEKAGLEPAIAEAQRVLMKAQAALAQLMAREVLEAAHAELAKAKEANPANAAQVVAAQKAVDVASAAYTLTLP